MRRNTGYISKRNQYKSSQLSAHAFSRQRTLDGVVIALGQMGVDADFLHNFNKIFLEVEHDLVAKILVDDLKSTYTNSRQDKTGEKLDFAYSKQKIDELILQYIHPEDYLAFDYRYGLKEMPKDEHISR